MTQLTSVRSRQGNLLERLVRDRWRGPGGIRGLSRAVGVSRVTMYAWFRGRSSPSAEILPSLAAALELSPTQLVAALEEPEVPDAEPGGARIGDVVSGAVAWCEADDPIGPVAHRLYEGNFSQMPVRDGGRWTGLLTTEAIARWMAGRTAVGLVVDERAPVREVVSYAEEPDNFHFVAPGERVADVAKLFAERTAEGRPLAAVLVVDNGRDRGELLGIVTPYDWPLLGVTARGQQQSARATSTGQAQR